MFEVKMGLRIVLWSLFGMALIVLLSVLGMFVSTGLLPWEAQIKRDVVENSKSFTDSSNVQLQRYITEYNGLDVEIIETTNVELETAYRMQQTAIIGMMCQMTSTMKPETVAPDIQAFLSMNGGCR